MFHFAKKASLVISPAHLYIPQLLPQWFPNLFEPLPKSRF